MGQISLHLQQLVFGGPPSSSLPALGASPFLRLLSGKLTANMDPDFSDDFPIRNGGSDMFFRGTSPRGTPISDFRDHSPSVAVH